MSELTEPPVLTPEQRAAAEAASTGGDSTVHEEEDGCVTHLSLTDDVISLERVFKAVALPSCGAVASFCGTTRDNFDGKEVVELFYESYDQMALKEMRKIEREVRVRWPDVKGVAIVHRKGLVPVCESSVVIAVSSPHRVVCFFLLLESGKIYCQTEGVISMLPARHIFTHTHAQASMDAVRFCIDTLKKSVPIWKKEIYREGLPGWKKNSEFMESEVMRGRAQTGSLLSSAGLVLAVAAGVLLLGGTRRAS